MKCLHLGVIVTKRFTLSAFAMLVDQLKLAEDQNHSGKRVEYHLMSNEDGGAMSSMGGLLRHNSQLLPANLLDAVIVVGDDDNLSNCRVDEPTLQYLRDIGSTGTPLIGIGGGTLVLCRAGVMQTHSLCVSWQHYREFRDAFPQQALTKDRAFMVDRLRITCVGVSGTAQLAHYLMQKKVGQEAARATPLSLLLSAPLTRDDYVRESSQQQLKDPRIYRCITLMEQSFSESSPIKSICAQMGLSTRQLERLFKRCLSTTPQLFYNRLRMRYALWLIEHTDRAVIDIAMETGFRSGPHFTRRFKVHFGHPPTVRRAIQQANGRTALGPTALQ